VLLALQLLGNRFGHNEELSFWVFGKPSKELFYYESKSYASKKGEGKPCYLERTPLSGFHTPKFYGTQKTKKRSVLRTLLASFPQSTNFVLSKQH
jgi:hypothetical protein